MVTLAQVGKGLRESTVANTPVRYSRTREDGQEFVGVSAWLMGAWAWVGTWPGEPPKREVASAIALTALRIDRERYAGVA